MIPRATGNPRPADPLDAAVAGALQAQELAEGPPQQTAYGWQLEIVGERARYFVCSAAEVCTFQRVDVPASSLRATKLVARGRAADGVDVDVYELTLVRDDSAARNGALWVPR